MSVPAVGDRVRVLWGPHAGMAATVAYLHRGCDPYDAGYVAVGYRSDDGRYSGAVGADQVEPIDDEEERE